MAESKKGAVLLILAAAVGGIGFVWLKELLDDGFTSLQCLWGRYAAANIFMGVCYIIKKRKISKEAFKKGAALGAILFVFFYVIIKEYYRGQKILVCTSHFHNPDTIETSEVCMHLRF